MSRRLCQIFVFISASLRNSDELERIKERGSAFSLALWSFRFSGRFTNLILKGHDFMHYE